MFEQNRRPVILGVAVCCLGLYLGSWWLLDGQGAWRFLTPGLGRIGLVSIALWLAWPSLRRPAAWLPPGISVGILTGFAIIAVQPRLAILVVPVFGALLTVSSLVRAFRSTDR